MRADEFDAWFASSLVGYAHDIARAGADPDAARTKSERDHAALLPNGVDSEGQDLYVLEDGGSVVGSLWLAERETDLGRSLFVYNVMIAEPYRGRGYGRAAMLFAEEEAQRRSIGAVALNVFGGNDVARRLYDSLGYVETAVAMRKDL